MVDVDLAVVVGVDSIEIQLITKMHLAAMDSPEGMVPLKREILGNPLKGVAMVDHVVLTVVVVGADSIMTKWQKGSALRGSLNVGVGLVEEMR